MPGAGQLRDRVRFFRRALDEEGRAVGEFELQFEVSAAIVYLKGGEPVMQSRLQGVQPVVITIRDSRQAREIGTAWRAEHQRLNAVFNLTAASPNKDRAFIDVLGQSEGVDAG